MKKVLSVLFAAIMLVSVSACSSAGVTTSTSEETIPTSTTSTMQMSTTTTKQPTTTTKKTTTIAKSTTTTTKKPTTTTTVRVTTTTTQKPTTTTTQKPTTTSTTQPPVTYGTVKGQITWQYNKVLGTRGDNGAAVMLIPMNGKTENFDNKHACMLASGTYESGIMVTKCDGYGNFGFGNQVPSGKYLVLIVSKNTTGAARFNDEEAWKAEINVRFGPYFSDEDMEQLMLFIGYSKLASDTIEVEEGDVHTLTNDFGYTYI